MTTFKKHRRKQIAELRPVTIQETLAGLHPNISVSAEDRKNGSPKQGDMIARNPKNHQDQWLVSQEYYVDNFEKIED